MQPQGEVSLICSFPLQPLLGLPLCPTPTRGTWIQSQPGDTQTQVPMDSTQSTVTPGGVGDWGGHHTPKALPGPTPPHCPLPHPGLLADLHCCAGSHASPHSWDLSAWATVASPCLGDPQRSLSKRHPLSLPLPLALTPALWFPNRRLEAVVPVGRVHAGLRGRPADADAHVPASTGRRGRRLRGGAGGGSPVQPQSLRP